jgi:hypothetical protein
VTRNDDDDDNNNNNNNNNEFKEFKEGGEVGRYRVCHYDVDDNGLQKCLFLIW